MHRTTSWATFLGLVTLMGASTGCGEDAEPAAAPAGSAAAGGNVAATAGRGGGASAQGGATAGAAANASAGRGGSSAGMGGASAGQGGTGEGGASAGQGGTGEGGVSAGQGGTGEGGAGAGQAGAGAGQAGAGAGQAGASAGQAGAGQGGTTAGQAGSGGGEASAGDDVATTARGVVVLIDVRANDGGSAAVTAFTNGTKGTTTLTTDGLLRYAPNPGADGNDELSYTLANGSSAKVAITIRPRAGTVVDGTLYTAVESQLPLDATEKEREVGFYWTDANGKGEAIGQFGAAAGARMVLRSADGAFATIPKPAGMTADSAQWGPLGMNEVGDVVGFWFDADFISSTGWIWNPSTGSKSFDATGLKQRTTTDITDDGLLIGGIEDYDAGLDWQLFTRPKANDAGEVLAQPAGYKHSPGYRVNAKRTVLGNAGNGGDGFSAPLRCYLADLTKTPIAFDVRANPAGVHSVDCRALDDDGRIGGKVYLTDKSFQRAFLWDAKGLSVVNIPFDSRIGDIRRGEEIIAIGKGGVLFGQILDLKGKFRAVELAPVPPVAGTSFEATVDRVAAFE